MSLLNKREVKGVRYTIQAYKKRIGPYPRSDDDLFVFLGDSPKSRLCWSAVSKRVPTYRRNGGKMFHLKSQSWLTGKDRLASLGFPITESTAMSMGVPVIPVQDQFRAASVAGNSFHFCTAAVVQLVALSCYRLVGNQGY